MTYPTTLLKPLHEPWLIPSLFQVASELNAAILCAQNQEETTPLLAELLKLLLWAQDELTKKKVQFPVMTDLIKAQIEEPKWRQSVCQRVCLLVRWMAAKYNK